MKLTRSQVRYCLRVGIAASFAYFLTLGNYNQYAIYSAFTAALIVGASVGEDLTTSANRAKGTMVGMIAAMAVLLVAKANVVTVGVGVLLTAWISVAAGWGIAVARIGVSLCIVTMAVHQQNALNYDLLRMANTLVGVVAGLFVSVFVWPIHARAELTRLNRSTALEIEALLDAHDRGEPLRPHRLKVLDGLASIVKASREVELEARMKAHVAQLEPLDSEVAQLGVIALAMTLEKDGGEAAMAPPPDLEALRARLREAAARG